MLQIAFGICRHVNTKPIANIERSLNVLNLQNIFIAIQLVLILKISQAIILISINLTAFYDYNTTL